jgi:prenyltransferase beta subunit
VVDRAINYILTKQDATGLFAGSMYDHALCTLAMIEAYGFIPKPQMRQSVQRAVDLIIKAQSPVGGWRYTPSPTDADLSVTVMQVVALRAAQNARLDVPQKTIDQARAYVRACAVAAGGFSYQPGGGASLAQTAAGSLSLQLLGGYDDPTDMLLVTKALDVLKAAKYGPGIAYQYYTTYYAMQSTFQVGGEYWANWHPRVRQWLLDNQAQDGSFPGTTEAAHNGPAQCYSTAMGAMSLSVYMHYLPAYQR